MWRRFDVIFALKSPLHIGYLPFKGFIISPTRYYILGKNFWGAITKKTTERLYEKPTSKDFKEIGKLIKDNFRFSYFYIYDNETIFIPKYSENGLLFGDKKEIDKFQFEQKFIGSRVSTSIDYSSGKAKDESLHEIEFIKDKFIDEKDKIRNTKIIGCIWFKENLGVNDKKIFANNSGIYINNINIIDELTIGGELNYGFGLVKLESINSEKIFPINDNNLIGNLIEIENKGQILSHLKYRKDISFKGEIEILTGRCYFDIEDDYEIDLDYKVNPGKIITKTDYYFSPGTIIINKEKNPKLYLDWRGILSVNH